MTAVSNNHINIPTIQYPSTGTIPGITQTVYNPPTYTSTSTGYGYKAMASGPDRLVASFSLKEEEQCVLKLSGLSVADLNKYIAVIEYSEDLEEERVDLQMKINKFSKTIHKFLTSEGTVKLDLNFRINEEDINFKTIEASFDEFHMSNNLASDYEPGLMIYTFSKKKKIDK